jgi:hypothetical protein
MSPRSFRCTFRNSATDNRKSEEKNAVVYTEVDKHLEKNIKRFPIQDSNVIAWNPK